MRSLSGAEAPIRDNDLHVPAATKDDPHNDLGATETRGDITAPPLMDDEYWARFPEPLTLQALGTVLRVSEATALRRLQDGTIPAHFLGRSWIVFQGEFRGWLAGTRNEPLPPIANTDPLADYDEQLGMSELMELFNKTKQTIRRWLTDKQIPGYLVGGRWTVYKSELREALVRTSNQRPVEQ